MAPRSVATSDDAFEFDLTRFLWGDLPPLAERQGADREARDDGPPSSMRDDVLLAEAVALRESSPTWDATAASTATVATEAEDGFHPDTDIDLDALAAWASLAEAVTIDEDMAADTAPAEEPDAPRLGENPLSYGELSERLRREVLPRLRWLTASRGRLTLGHLARVVLNLQGSEAHLAQVRDFLERAGVPILPSRSHDSARHLPLWAVQQARRRFGDLLGEQIDEEAVIARLGYDGAPLSQEAHAFLVQAWLGHCLAREEERAHAATVAAEIARGGEDLSRWSAAALAARTALIEDNRWLVARLARRFVDCGVALDDLLEPGAQGLAQAVVSFDPACGYRLASFASGWVLRSLDRYLASSSPLVIHAARHNGHLRTLPMPSDRADPFPAAKDVRHPTPDSVWEAMGQARPNASH